jgi:hypothetical protein
MRFFFFWYSPRSGTTLREPLVVVGILQSGSACSCRARRVYSTFRAWTIAMRDGPASLSPFGRISDESVVSMRATAP